MKLKLRSCHLQGFTKKNDEKGFTLAELLIFIVITGILPAVAMPFILDHYDLRASRVHTGEGVIYRHPRICLN